MREVAVIMWDEPAVREVYNQRVSSDGILVTRWGPSDAFNQERGRKTDAEARRGRQ